MKFTSNMLSRPVEIGSLKKGDTFIDPYNFDDREVFMIVCPVGYDCDVGFHNDELAISAVNLTSGELWAYRTTEEVVKVVTEDITFKPAH